MANELAPTQANPIRWIFPRLVVLEVDALKEPPEPRVDPEEQDEPSPHRGPDDVLRQMHVAFVKQAYVLVLPFPADAKRATYCRTDDEGNLLRVDKGSLDAVPANEAKNRAPFAADQKYYVYWSTSRQVFDAMAADVTKNVSAALANHPFFEWETKLTPLFAYKDAFAHQFAHHALDRMKFGVLLHNLGVRAPGYVSGYDLQDARFERGFHGSRDEIFLFARRPAIAALYFAEYVNHRALQLRQDSAWSYSVLHSALAFVRAAEEQGSVATIEDLQKGAPLWSARGPHRLEFRRYAHDCAVARRDGKRVERDAFETSVDDRVNSWKDARDAAYEIGDKFGVRHPAWRDDGDWDPGYTPAGLKAVTMRYFDVYRFGAEWGEKPLEGSVSESEAGIGKQLGAIAGHAGDFLEQHGKFSHFLWDLGAHIGDDEKARDALMERYGVACMCVGTKWWTEIPTEQGDPYWERFKAYFDYVFRGTAKGGEVFKAIFEHHAEQLAKSLEHAAEHFPEEFEKLYKKMYSCNKYLKGGTKTVQVGDYALEAEFQTVEEGGRVRRQGRVVIKKGRKSLGDFDFLVAQAEGADGKPLQRTRQLPDGRGPTQKKGRPGKPKFRTIVDQELEFDLGKEPKIGLFSEPNLEVPEFMVNLATTALVAFELWNFRRNLKESDHPIELVAKVGIDVALAMQGWGEALHVAFRGSSTPWLARAGHLAEHAGKVAGTVGAVAEIVMCGHEAYILLYDREESEIGDDVHDGDMLAADVHFAKGMILAAGAVAATVDGIFGIYAAGAITLAALGPAGVIIAATAGLAVVCDLIVTQARGSSSTMDPFVKKLTKALVSEFGREYYPEKTDDSFQVSRTYEALSIFREEVVAAGRSLDHIEDLEGAAVAKKQSDARRSADRAEAGRP